MNSGKPRILICLSSIDRPVVFENPGRSTSQSNQVTDEPPLNVPSSSTSVQCGYVGAAQQKLSEGEWKQAEGADWIAFGSACSNILLKTPMSGAGRKRETRNESSHGIGPTGVT